jgi:rhodanese-related sulfurtransferase
MAMTAMDLVAEAKRHITEIGIDEAQGALGKSLIVDVREPGEYAAGCLPGAVNIPRGVLEFKIGAHPDFQGRFTANIVVYCQTGGRSALATEALQKLGYSGAVSMAGGFSAWSESGKPVAKP